MCLPYQPLLRPLYLCPGSMRAQREGYLYAGSPHWTWGVGVKWHMGWCAESAPRPRRHTLVPAPGAVIRSLIHPIEVASDRLKSPSAIYLPESPISYRYITRTALPMSTQLDQEQSNKQKILVCLSDLQEKSLIRFIHFNYSRSHPLNPREISLMNVWDMNELRVCSQTLQCIRLLQFIYLFWNMLGGNMWCDYSKTHYLSLEPLSKNKIKCKCHLMGSGLKHLVSWKKNLAW